MKLYNVRLYSIGYNEDLGNDVFLGKVIIKNSFFGAEEAKTGCLIRKVPYATIGEKHPSSYLRPYAYKAFGYDLAIIKEDINEENIAGVDDLEKYLEEFDSTDAGIALNKVASYEPDLEIEKSSKK